MNKNSYLTIVYYFLLIALTIFIYSFGWSGTWHYDDEGALNQLSLVFDNGVLNSLTAWQFIFEGTAGPLGRPIALASFLIDGSGWPNEPSELLRTNSFLHALNGLLIFAVFLRLSMLKGVSQNTAVSIAVISTTLWILLPIHVSSALMAVQRMTLLSSTFMLLGLWIYLAGRQVLTKKPRTGWALIFLGLGGGTLLGVFSKEQAILLPVLAWVLEAWLIPRPHFQTFTQQRLWKYFRVGTFYIPTLIIVSYLLKELPNANVNYMARNFTLSDRLWTEPVILWDYLRLAFFPHASEFGPFHDDYPIFNLSLVSGLAVTAWVAVLVLAFKLRKKTKLPMFALLWFWSAHLLESTTIPLELYFEHRNYLAVAGPIFAAIFAITCWASKHDKKAITGFILATYAALLAIALFQTTSLFGQPVLAAEIWYLNHPKSARSAQYLVQASLFQGDKYGAIRILEKAADENKNSAILRMQSLLLSCEVGIPTSDVEFKYQQVINEIPHAPKQFNVSSLLITMKAMHADGICKDTLNSENLIKIANLALNNPVLTATNIEKANLHVFSANYYIEKRNLGQTMGHFISALKVMPHVDILRQSIATLLTAGLEKEALELLEQHPPKYPKNPWLRKQQQKEWVELKNIITSKTQANS